MTRVYEVFDKFCVVDIIFGLILGIYLAINHNNPDLYIIALIAVFIFSFIMTLLPIASVIYAKYKYKEKIPIRAIIEAYILNFGMTAVSFAFGYIIGSFAIGNYNTANWLLIFWKVLHLKCMSELNEKTIK